MGIRFACHACGKPLNIKSSLAGRRGVCPACQIRFRIPHSDAPTSDPVSDQTPPESSLAIMDDDATATWYVRPPAGGQYGPADRPTLQTWIDQGRVARGALLWRDGWPQWRSAAEALPDMIDRLAAADTPPVSTASSGATSAASPHSALSSTALSSAGLSGMARPALSGDANLGRRVARIARTRILSVIALSLLLLGLLAVLVYLLVR